MDCVSQIVLPEQRSANTWKTSKNQNQNILAAKSKDETQPVFPGIQFSLAPNTEAWILLDSIISKILYKNLWNKEYNQRLNESSHVINTICMRIYGEKEKNNKPPVKKNRRQRMIQDLSMKIDFKKYIRFPNVDEKRGSA